MQTAFVSGWATPKSAVNSFPRTASATHAIPPSASMSVTNSWSQNLCFAASSAVLAVASAAQRRQSSRKQPAAIRFAQPDSPSRPSQDPEIDPRRQDPPRTVPPVRMPMVDSGSGEKLDVMSKLLQDRIIICGGEVKDEMAQVLVAQMLYLANEGTEDITMYINSPGGSVSAGMAIYDTMQFIPCDVSTVCFGLAASMGSFLLAAGTKGKRKSLPNSRIMIHQPLGGAQGQATDVRIQAREILHLREILNMHLADATGQPKDKIEKDCDRDNFMTPEEAKAYGLIDEIIPTKSWPRIQKPARPGL
jgi:ATP-dependent Clp protease, protease subunit